ncbi:hypothetical protein BM477_02640 [Boudabousia marimammalium]|uniref:Uncharacterized protein n=1 Tax=Boudabousia marimammalium TaxID=156892 RepID=A0A1Q5PRZ5_9ACTO|nr:hypothetical protein BM477_02640 [Boudabousia marimammalium]
MGRIKAASQRLNFLINDMMTLVKLDEGQPLAAADFDLTEVAEEIADHYVQLLAAQGGALQVKVEPGLVAHGDEGEYLNLDYFAGQPQQIRYREHGIPADSEQAREAGHH